LIGSDLETAIPMVRPSSLRMLLTKPTHTVHYYWRKFDDALMRPMFGGRGFVPYTPGSPTDPNVPIERLTSIWNGEAMTASEDAWLVTWREGSITASEESEFSAYIRSMAAYEWLIVRRSRRVKKGAFWSWFRWTVGYGTNRKMNPE
jgi:hypothetical protein